MRAPAPVAPPERGRAGDEPAKYDYVDALRGYAILLVIMVHVGSAFLELPTPVKRYTNLGWYGVQLFFVTSSLTLAMSWHARPADGLRTAQFFVRRLFRIAPMYYAATLYYLMVRPPLDSFSVSQLLASSLFAHGWSPATLPTTSDWTVVPGSWSVAAEFGFYLLLPALLLLATSLGRAITLLVLSLPLAYVANQLAMAQYVDTHGFVATDQFVFFWLPNQLPVFLSGIVLYYVLRRAEASPGAVLGKDALARHAQLIVGGAALAFLAVPFLAIPRLPGPAFPFLPIHLLVSLVFCAAIAALAMARRHFLVNRPVVWMGKVSFSAYLLHFSVIPTLAGLFPAVFAPGSTGFAAIFHFAVLFGTAVVVTFLVSYVTYRLIELPLIAVGKHVCGRLAARSRPA